MSETASSQPPAQRTPSMLTDAAQTDTAKRLASAIGVTEAALADTLLHALDAGDAGVSIKDMASGRYVHVNARLADFLGHPLDRLRGLTEAEVLTPNQAAAVRSAEKGALGRAGVLVSEQRIERGGRKRDFHVLRVGVARDDGVPPNHVLAVWTELTEARDTALQLKQALAQLEQRQLGDEAARREAPDSASRDGATGLYQKAHFDDQLRREVDLSSREHREFALVWIALDAFSDEVKAFGDAARARVLESLGQLLRGNTRAMDASCRLDDDRFAVLLSGVGLATAHSRMEGLRRQCATQIVVLGGQDIGFTVSMGVASFPHTANTEDELMNAAEHALQEAKKRGGNHVALASIRFELGAA